MSRADVLAHFSRDEEALVRGVLQDLTDSGLLFRSGVRAAAVYRTASPAEMGQARKRSDDDAVDSMRWALIRREGPVTSATLLERNGAARAGSRSVPRAPRDGRPHRTGLHGGRAAVSRPFARHPSGVDVFHPLAISCDGLAIAGVGNSVRLRALLWNLDGQRALPVGDFDHPQLFSETDAISGSGDAVYGTVDAVPTVAVRWSTTGDPQTLFDPHDDVYAWSRDGNAAAHGNGTGEFVLRVGGAAPVPIASTRSTDATRRS